MTDMKWLEKRHQTWYAVLDVPRPLRKKLGKRRFVKSLRTRDIGVARQRRHVVLAEFHRTLKLLQRDRSGDPMVERGLDWKESIIEHDDDDTAYLAFHEDLAKIAASKGVRAAQSMHGAATGTRTPLFTYIEPWLLEGGRKGPLKESTKADYRSTLAPLEKWGPMLESYSKKEVSRWAMEQLALGRDRRTINKTVAVASSYWAWLVKRSFVEGNPWVGQSVGQGDSAGHKRAFTDAEVAKLLVTAPKGELGDLMRIAALSGMRQEEILNLRGEDCRDGWFTVKEGKTKSSVRRIPIHSALGALPRIEGAAGISRIFSGNANGVSMSFGRHRVIQGIDEHVAGRRQSNVDFHSFRRWFVTKARTAGIDRAVVASVVGHKVGNLTDDVYSSGPSDAQKIACVEAVTLPPLGAH